MHPREIDSKTKELQYKHYHGFFKEGNENFIVHVAIPHNDRPQHTPRNSHRSATTASWGLESTVVYIYTCISQFTM